MAAEAATLRAGADTAVTSRALRRARALLAEVALVRLGLGVVALHVIDDNFLQPAPGQSPDDHAASGLVPLLVLALAAFAYPRLRAGRRAAAAATLGVLALIAGVPAGYYLYSHDLSGDHYSGLLAIPAGLAMIATGVLVAWRSRRLGGSRRRRYARRSLRALVAAPVAALLVFLVLFPVGLAYVYPHAGRTPLTPAIGVPLERVTVTTSDSLELAAWYAPSRNRAAVVLFPGADRGKEARMLIRNGYGVLLLEPRGEGGSQGDVIHWAGDRDVRAGGEYLQTRPDVDPTRVGAIGFSVGGEKLLEAAAQSPAFRAVVAEGAGERVGETHDSGLLGPLVDASQLMMTAAVAVLSNEPPPPPLAERVALIAPRAAMFVYADPGMGGENVRQPRYYAAAGEPKALWKVPGSTHTEGISAQPAEYERRVVGFLDAHLLGPR